MKDYLPKLSIVNLVATAELGRRVNLQKLQNVKGFLYDLSIYRCAYLKDKKTRAKVLVFGTGKMISVGAKSLQDANRDLNYAATRLSQLDLIPTTRVTTKLQNIVATADIGQSISLEILASKLPDCIYEPEQFPGAIYYAEELEGASILIFANGKMVLAGIKRQELLEAGRRIIGGLARQIL